MDLIKKAGKFAGVVLTGVGGLWGLIFGLAQDGMTAVAAVGLSIVLLSFFLYIAVALIVSLVQKVSGHDAAVSAAGQAREELAEAKQELEKVPTLIEQARQDGRLDAIGAMLADASGAVLRVTNTTRVNGALAIVAALIEGECPRPGARFLLRSADVQTKRGIVAVDSATEDGKVFLTVRETEPGSDAFWQDAARRADTTEAAPGALELVADTLIADITTERAEK